MKKCSPIMSHFLPVFLASIFSATLAINSNAWGMAEQEFYKKLGEASSNHEIRMVYEEKLNDLPLGSAEQLEAIIDLYLNYTKLGEPYLSEVSERLPRDFPDNPRALSIYSTYLEKKSKHEEALKALHTAWKKSYTPGQQKIVLNTACDHNFNVKDVLTGRYTGKIISIDVFMDKAGLYRAGKISRKELQSIYDNYISQHPKTGTLADEDREQVLAFMLDLYLEENNFPAAHAILDKMRPNKTDGVDLIATSHVRIFKKERKMDKAAVMLNKMASQSSDPEQKKEYLREARELSSK